MDYIRYSPSLPLSFDLNDRETERGREITAANQGATAEARLCLNGVNQ